MFNNYLLIGCTVTKFKTYVLHLFVFAKMLKRISVILQKKKRISDILHMVALLYQQKNGDLAKYPHVGVKLEECT